MMDEILKKLVSSKNALIGGVYIEEGEDGLPKTTGYKMPEELADFIKNNKYFNESLQENVDALDSIFKKLFTRLEEEEQQEEKNKTDSGKNIIYLGD